MSPRALPAKEREVSKRALACQAQAELLLVTLRNSSVSDISPVDADGLRRTLASVDDLLKRHAKPNPADVVACLPPFDPARFRVMKRLLSDDDVTLLRANGVPVGRFKLARRKIFFSYWGSLAKEIFKHMYASRHVIMSEGLYELALQRYGTASVRMAKLALAGLFFRYSDAVDEFDALTALMRGSVKVCSVA